MPAFVDWPRRKSGIRPNFPQMPQAQQSFRKWHSFTWVTKLHGQLIGDKWKAKRPQKTVSKVEREIKLRTDVISNPPKDFPNLKHPSGCSLQYIIMLAECLGGAEWYEPYIRRTDEYLVANPKKEAEMKAALKELAKR